MTRATDRQGITQPDRVPFNEKGYLFNQPVSRGVNAFRKNGDVNDVATLYPVSHPPMFTGSAGVPRSS